MNRNALTPELEADKPPFSDNMLPVFYKQRIIYSDCYKFSKNVMMTYTYFSKDLTPYALPASFTALSMNSMVIFLVGCSLKIEFMRAILAALLLASALVGHV